MEPDPIEAAAALLDTSRTASLATVAPDGTPHACNVQFVRVDGLDLVWASSPGSAHSQHLAEHPAAALTVYGHADTEPGGIHGVQLRGRAVPVERSDALWAAYVARFPVAAGMTAAFDAGRQQLYRFRPDWVRWIDNRRGFGFKIERDLSGRPWT